MKKILFFMAFVLVSVVSAAQDYSNMTEPRLLARFSNITSDTFVTLKVPKNVTWAIQNDWTRNTDSLGFAIKGSLTNSGYYMYDGLDTTWTTDATSAIEPIAFGDVAGIESFIMREYVYVTDTASVTIWFYFKPLSK